MEPIGYISDPVPAYCEAVGSAEKLDDLRAAVASCDLITADALTAIDAPDFNFAEFAKGRAKERRGRFAGEEWSRKYGCILMPEIMLRVSMIAQHFLAPWGCAYIRARDEGFLEERDGRAVWVGRH